MMSRSNFYVVYKGRVDDPTIFSSWAQVHPKVTEYSGADHEGFETLEYARNSLRKRGFSKFTEVVKNGSGKKNITKRGEKFHAIAYGKNTGIFEDYSDVEQAIKGFRSACHQSFNTREEAERFIDEWNISYNEVQQREDKWHDSCQLSGSSGKTGDAEKDLVLGMGNLAIGS
ncbi:hypothetical protein BJX70DRAFT_378667 [Aspergillus crustosus]